MKRVLLVDLQNFFWSYIGLRQHLDKYNAVVFIYSSEQFKAFEPLKFLIKRIVRSSGVIDISFYEVTSREDGISLKAKIIEITNCICDQYNPLNDVIHLMCNQLPENIIKGVLDENGYYFSDLKGSPICLKLSDENEAEHFLNSCHKLNIKTLPINLKDIYDPNEIMKDENDGNMIDIELFSLSVIDFVRNDFRLFGRNNKK